ncbi:hypothetical protein JNUCC83_08675 [Vagococcus sp. JNUCC 83]
MTVRELISYYEKEIHYLLQDQMNFPYDDLDAIGTIKIYQRFIKDLEQLF